MKLSIKYQHVSIALDIAAAGVGALGGPLNAMTAVIGKRGLERAIRHSAERIASRRRRTRPEPEFELATLVAAGLARDSENGVGTDADIDLRAGRTESPMSGLTTLVDA
jgi:hypothetical protein